MCQRPLRLQGTFDCSVVQVTYNIWDVIVSVGWLCGRGLLGVEGGNVVVVPVEKKNNASRL